MIIEWRKGAKAFSGLTNQPYKKPNGAFCIYIIATEIVKFRDRNLLANQRFAVEILKFRLSIVVMKGIVSRYTRQMQSSRMSANNAFKFCGG